MLVYLIGETVWHTFFLYFNESKIWAASVYIKVRCLKLGSLIYTGYSLLWHDWYMMPNIDCLSKIWMCFFDQVSTDAKSVFKSMDPLSRKKCGYKTIGQNIVCLFFKYLGEGGFFWHQTYKGTFNNVKSCTLKLYLCYTLSVFFKLKAQDLLLAHKLLLSVSQNARHTY